MRRSLWILLAVLVVGVPALGFVATRSTAARVLAKDERIQVMPSTGQWYRTFVVRVGVPGARAAEGIMADSSEVSLARDQFDAVRVGARVRLSRVAFLPGLSWLSDSASRTQTIANIVEPHLKLFYSPAPVSALEAQVAGLARVVAVHSIKRRKFFWQKTDTAVQWMHLVEVEFWSQRVRTLVRTIDVIDAGSIPGLHKGDILQMHFDPRNPRVMRLDDGRRTFAKGR